MRHGRADADRYFNPLPSCEGRRMGYLGILTQAHQFQSTPPCEGDLAVDDEFSRFTFQSTPSCGETDFARQRLRMRQFQSTPHARRLYSPFLSQMSRFQSTPLMRGETNARARIKNAQKIFNPLPSCERLFGLSDTQSIPRISIHSPHARGDHRNRPSAYRQ